MDFFFIADGPTFLYHPRTTSGDRLATITLHCIVDSNPQPQYYWTRDSSLEVRLLFSIHPFFITLFSCVDRLFLLLTSSNRIIMGLLAALIDSYFSRVLNPFYCFRNLLQASTKIVISYKNCSYFKRWLLHLMQFSS